MVMRGPGDFVMYVLDGGQRRPALIVQSRLDVLLGQCLDLQVFTNGDIDAEAFSERVVTGETGHAGGNLETSQRVPSLVLRQRVWYASANLKTPNTWHAIGDWIG